MSWRYSFLLVWRFNLPDSINRYREAARDRVASLACPSSPLCPLRSAAQAADWQAARVREALGEGVVRVVEGVEGGRSDSLWFRFASRLSLQGVETPNTPVHEPRPRPQGTYIHQPSSSSRYPTHEPYYIQANRPKISILQHGGCIAQTIEMAR